MTANKIWLVNSPSVWEAVKSGAGSCQCTKKWDWVRGENKYWQVWLLEHTPDKTQGRAEQMARKADVAGGQ
jgi:hypothetical protein